MQRGFKERCLYLSLRIDNVNQTFGPDTECLYPP